MERPLRIQQPYYTMNTKSHYGKRHTIELSWVDQSPILCVYAVFICTCTFTNICLNVLTPPPPNVLYNLL